MEIIGKQIKNSMQRQSQSQNSKFRFGNARGGMIGGSVVGREISFLALKSKKMNFDHLAIRDQQSKAFKKVSAILKYKGESFYSKIVFSDYMYKYK